MSFADTSSRHASRRPLSGRTIVFLHAHPDDESIFTGATMRRLADRGARVVLVTATGGELGGSFSTLPPGETIGTRRRVELEAAAGRLGVDRLVLLGRRDSGMAGWPSIRHPLAFARGRVDRLARRLARIAEQESAEAIIHYDEDGIYRHPDHVAVHRVGAAAARMAGVHGFEATVDRDHLGRLRGQHVLDLASPEPGGYGRTGPEIPLTIIATESELTAKHAAMAAHASQISVDSLRWICFPACYAQEWYLHAGEEGILGELN